MDEFVRMVNVSREYALERKEEIVKEFGSTLSWNPDALSDHNYWEGHVDALENVLRMVKNV